MGTGIVFSISSTIPSAVAPDQLALEDDIRLLYVAYSRAQYGLILVGTQDQLKRHVAIPGGDFTKFRRETQVV